MVATDYFSKWIEVDAFSSINYRDVTQFIWKNIVFRFGIPRSIVSDKGPQFDSRVYRDFCQELKIKNLYSTPQYPQSNGQAEASNQTLLTALKKRLDSAKRKWVEELPGVLWAYRTTAWKPIDISPFTLAYGMEAVIPTEVGLPTIRADTPDSENAESIIRELDVSDELREAAIIRITSYQRRLANSYKKTCKASRVSARQSGLEESFREYCKPHCREIPTQLGRTLCRDASR